MGIKPTSMSVSPQSSVARKILRLGTPLLFVQLTHYLHQIADSAMLGHYGSGSLELAAIGIAGLVTWILMTFLWPLSAGVQALASRRYGRQQADSTSDKAVTGEVLDNGLVVGVLAALLALGVSLLVRPVLGVLLQSEGILDLVMDYVDIIRFSLVPMGFFIIGQGFMGAINRTRPVMYAGVLSNLLNIALNWLLIFGNLGLPAMGIQGAALGTALATGVAALYLIAVLVLQGYRRDYRLFTFRALSARLQKDMVRVALPPGIQNILALMIFLVFQTLVEGYGAIYLAATHSIFAYMRLNKTIIGGFARAASILVGNALGRGDKVEAQEAMTTLGVVGGGIAVTVAIGTVFARGYIAALFTNDPATQTVLATGLLFFTGFYFMEALGYAFEMVFVSNGYGRYVLFSELSTNVVFILGATLLARYFFPEHVVLAWFSFGLYQVCHAAFMIGGFMRGRWLNVEVES
ncbi:MAG: MATE family efflux transporter [Spirochaeta sp.]|nr:MATE family efflux transporter [Spirochaeta sp.]